MTSQASLRSEIERQQAYLDQLPDDYEWPVFNTKVALHSMRKSGYRSTASAAREIVDNAIEAEASRIDVVFRSVKSATSGRNKVAEVAFIDDGSGMLPDMARFALTWGGGTHFDDPQMIGKFGFGLPNASINQTRFVEVFSRISESEGYRRTYLDLDLFGDYGVQSVPPPEPSNLPEWVQRYTDKKDLTSATRTVVIWREPDRLSYNSPARLKEHLLDDFGVVYRYLLMRQDAPLQITVQDVDVRSVDPLFLSPEALLYEPPTTDLDASEGGGAREVETWFIPVKYVKDPETEERRLQRMENAGDVDLNDPTLITMGTIFLRMARFPIGFARGERKYQGTDAYRRWEIRKSRRGMTFVRSNREIEIVDAFPKSAADKSNGLGDWPLLQSYAYHWGIEVRFNPALDEVFGITNDKQSVRPIEDFWRVLTEVGVDDAAHRENNWQSKAREKQQTVDPDEEPSDEPTAAEEAARDADVASSESPIVPRNQRETAKKNLEEEIDRRSEITGEDAEKIREQIDRAAQKKRYAVEYFDSPDGPFYEPEWVGPIIRVKINTAHPFYTVLYQELLKLRGGLKAKLAIDVLLLALARAELTATDDDVVGWYRGQRKRRWNTFLEDALTSLETRLASALEPLLEADEGGDTTEAA